MIAEPTILFFFFFFPGTGARSAPPPGAHLLQVRSSSRSALRWEPVLIACPLQTTSKSSEPDTVIWSGVEGVGGGGGILQENPA
ncbi:hypothetical protein EYF80_047219 [Liparis tanakae]|uniref:Secreted protein n=1 Tax=Liparis tanakae TaxID=230148 RepID=A0A4Z2FMX8_9TELE|nr:hypothetical protein EYF80_047219 [Liparis tanakae]